jgi:DNA-binding NarL/FixJ family response regulator
LIADDHAVIRRGLRSILGRIAGVEVCGETENGAETIRRVRLDHPDLVLLDLNFPDLDGIAVLHALRTEFPEIDVLIFSMYEDQNLVSETIRLGARGYLMKSDSEEAYRRAIDLMRSHRPFFSERLKANMTFRQAEKKVGTASPGPSGLLTKREVDVLRLLAQGKRNKEVASALGISRRTVEVHRRHIMDKLKISSYSELVVYAVRNQIIDSGIGTLPI